MTSASPPLYGNLQQVALRRCGDARHCGIGHQAVGRQIPRTLTLADATHLFRENVDLERVKLAVRAFSRGRSDIVSSFDIGEIAFRDAKDGNIRGEHYRDLPTVARFDHQGRAVELLDRAADPCRRPVVGLPVRVEFGRPRVSPATFRWRRRAAKIGALSEPPVSELSALRHSPPMGRIGISHLSDHWPRRERNREDWKAIARFAPENLRHWKELPGINETPRCPPRLSSYLTG